jgi:hypothetical protein
MKRISLVFLVLIALQLYKNNTPDYIINQEEDQLYDDGHFDAWNHKKPNLPDDESYMEGYSDGKKYRSY